MSKHLRLSFIGLLSVLLAFAGCHSVRKIAYKYADWFALNELDNYFDLTSTQEAELKPKIATHIAWFRAEGAKDVVKFLAEVRARAYRGFQDDDLVELRRQFEDVAKSIMRRLAPETAEFLSQLSDAQVMFFEKKLAKSNRRWEDLLAKADDDLRKAREKLARNNLKSWLGSSTLEQIAIYVGVAGDQRESLSVYLNERKAAQHTFVMLLKERKGPKDILQTLNIWIDKPDLMRPENLRSGYQERIARQEREILAIEKTLIKKQRQHLHEQITAIMDLLSGKS